MIFPPFTGPFGGERKLLRLACSLSKMGHSVSVYTPRYNHKCDYMIDHPIEIVETGFVSSGSWYMFQVVQPLFMTKLAFRLDERQVDIIDAHNHPSLASILVAKYMGKLRNTPIVYECNEPPRFLYDLKKETLEKILSTPIKRAISQLPMLIYRQLDKSAVRYVDEIIVLSSFIQKQVKEIYDRNSTVTREGVDIAKFNPQVDGSEIRRHYLLADDDPLIITVNKLHHRKRLDLLIKAAPFILERFPKAKVLIVGEGPEKSMLKTLINSLNLQKSVILTGFVSGGDLPKYYAAADIFVFTASKEPLPGSPLEAMASGKPVILPREGGCPEICTDGENGLFFPSGDVEALVDQVCLLIENIELRRKLGKNAREHVEKNFTWDKATIKTLQVYERAINKI